MLDTQLLVTLESDVTMPVHFIKWLFAATGLGLLIFGVMDHNWPMAATGLALALVLFVVGVGLERLILKTGQRWADGPWRLSTSTARKILVVIGAIILVLLVWR